MNKKKVIIDAAVVSTIMLAAGCLDPEGAIGQFFTDPQNQKAVEGAGGIAGFFGPVGAAIGSGATALYAVGRSYFTSKKANKDKDSLADEVKRGQEAFKGVVYGLQKAKAELPKEQIDKLHDGLSKHVPDWVHEVVNEVKGKPQKYKG